MNDFLTSLGIWIETPAGLLPDWPHAAPPLLAQSVGLMPVVVGVAVTVVLVVGVAWLLHAYTLRAGRKELAVYKEQVVALSDKIDALQERHKLLPYTEQNVAVPISGETLAAYQEVAQRLEHHRQVWVKLMDVREQVQLLLESESMLGSRRARLARRSLRAADAPAALAALLNDCETPLDRIEQAHAQAAADRKAYQQEDQQLGAQLEAVAAAALSVDPYQPDRLAAAALVERAQGLLPADPLATLGCLGEARGKIAEVRRRAAKILEHAGSARELANRMADIEQTATQRRSQGFLLLEEGANPDPLLADARQQQAAAGAALNQADEAAAGTLLSTALALTDQARDGMERHVAAKARCESEIPTRQKEARRLADVHAQARGQHAELARDFAMDTWLGVAENTQRAQASLADAERFTEEAAGNAAANVQRFLYACKLLDQAATNHRPAEAELMAVGQRLRELVELRAACQVQIGQLRSQSDRVNHLLQSNTADRALTNERFRAARSSLDRVVEESRLPRPDWTRLMARVRELESDSARVEQLAKEDIQLAQQAVAEIAETEQAIREARAFQEFGFTPDVSAAESQLAQARGSAAAQAYEQAIRFANAAEQTARAAHQDAITRAQRRQQELESQRRAEQASALVSPNPQLPAEADKP